MSEGSNLMPEGGESNKPVRSGRWMTIILAVSLSLNLAIVGLVIGANISGHAPHDYPGDGPQADILIMRELGLGPFLSAFEQDDRRKIIRLMRDHVGSAPVNRDTLAAELTSFLDAVKAVPFDPAKLETLMTQQTMRVTTRAEAGRNVILETIGEMSDAERAVFVQRMERAMQRALERARGRGRP